MMDRLKPTVLLLSTLIAGCSALPASGPTEREVLDAEKSPENTLGFHIVDVSSPVVATLQADRGRSLATIGGSSHTGRMDAIGAGDTLNIAIFEVGNGLFSGSTPPTPSPTGEAPAGNTSASSVRLPPVQVDARGIIGLPFVGHIRAAGRTPTELADVIRGSLKNLSQDPQVVVSIADSVSTAVFVQGDVKQPGRRNLTLNGERLLDAIALSGGTSYPSQDMTVELTRGGQVTQASLPRVEQDPSENVLLRPADRIRLVHQTRTFTVFGAAGKVSEVPFDAAELSLAEAVARSGGPQNDRADPNAVFLFRFEPSKVAEQLGLPASADSPGPASQPVIFKLDLMQPSSYFLAQRFAMQDKDLIYMANARTDRFSKFVSIVYNIAFPAVLARQFTQ